MEIQRGRQQEAHKSFWSRNNLFSRRDDLHLQNERRSGAHLNLRRIYDQASVQFSIGSPEHSAFSRAFVTFASLLRQKNIECLVCQDSFKRGTCFHAPCGHYFCPECTPGMAEAAISEGNEGLFPLRCCDKQFPLEKYLKLLPETLRESVVAKLEEISIPPPERLYCPNDACSTFIGRPPQGIDVMPCPKCRTEICLECKRTAHSPDPCGPPAENLTREATQYASKMGWQVCPRCAVFVERLEGCSHMMCRCGTSFCYSCGRSGCRCD